MAIIKTIDGEDAGEKSPWEWTAIVEEGSADFSLDEDAKNTGSYGYRVTPDGTATNEAYGRYDFTMTDHIYVRAYVKISADALGTDASQKIFLISLLVGGTYKSYLGVETGGSPYAPYRWYGAIDGSTFASSANFSLGSWHYLELHHYLEEDDGGGRAWVDGTLVRDTLGTGSTSDMTRCYGGAYNRNLGSGTIDIDDVVLATTGPIGAISGSSVVIASSYFMRRRSMD